MAGCEQCPLKGRPIVQGYGVPGSLAVIGDAPSQTDVMKGQPFVGKSGKILRQTLKAAGFDPDKVWYTYACLCNPVDKKKKPPTSGAFLSCRDRLLGELRDVQPEKILTLSGVATAALLGVSSVPITKTRGLGMMVDIPDDDPQGSAIRVYTVPTYHSDAILTDEDLFRDFADDIWKLASTEEPMPRPEVEIWNPETVDEAGEMLEVLFENASMLSCDLETEGFNFQTDKIISVGFGALKEDGTGLSLIIRRELLEHLKWTIASWMRGFDGYIVFHNIKFDLKFFQQWLGKPLDLQRPMDTMLMKYAQDERPFNRYPVHGLKTIARVRYDIPDYHFNFDDWFAAPEDLRDWNKLWAYHAQDCYFTIRLFDELRTELEEESLNLMPLVENILVPCSIAFSEAEFHGVLIDVPYFEKIKSEIEEKLLFLEARLSSVARDLAGLEDFNPKSPKQVNQFFSECGIEVGSTEKEALQFLERNIRNSNREMAEIEADFIHDLMDHRQWSKVLATYVDGLLQRSDTNGRVHSDFLLHGTATGRLSSNNPNLQNIPTLMGKDIRRGFKVPDGWSIVEADYSQLELRIAGYLSRDEKLIQTYKEGRDLHKLVAAAMYKKPVEEVTWLERYMAKYIDFGIIYGRGGKSLVEGWEMEHYVTVLGGTRWTLEEANTFIDAFLDDFPGLRDWIKMQARIVKSQGYVTTPFGRRRRFPLRTDEAMFHIQRQAANTPIQSTASDLCLTAFGRIHQRLKVEYTGVSNVLFSVHDAIYTEVRDDYLTEVVPLIQYEMAENLPPQIDRTVLPFKADVKIGKNWGDAKGD